MKKIIYPGTFDPITNGHLALIHRAMPHFEIIIAVNAASRKNVLFSTEERLQLIKESLRNYQVSILPFSGFLIDFARQQNISTILRGLRGNTDFEYELQLAHVNKRLAPEIETIFLMANENNTFISSSFIKEIASLHGSIEEFVPKPVAIALKNKFNY